MRCSECQGVPSQAPLQGSRLPLRIPLIFLGAWALRSSMLARGMICWGGLVAPAVSHLSFQVTLRKFITSDDFLEAFKAEQADQSSILGFCIMRWVGRVGQEGLYRHQKKAQIADLMHLLLGRREVVLREGRYG